jgi:hypothetical protein
MGSMHLEFAGWFQTFDLTVEGANHYITENASISIQTWLGLDESFQFEQKQFEELDGRVRSADPVLGLLLRTRLMSNPAPGWLKDEFVTPCPQGRTIMKRKVTDPATGVTKYKTRLFLPATLDDNPDKTFVEQYKFKLLSKPAHMRARYLYGDWDAQEGGFFEDDWNPTVHVIEPFKIPRDWPKFRSLDWGYKSMGVIGWFALDPDDNLYMFYEFSFRLMNSTECAKRVKDIELQFGFWDKAEKRSRLLSNVADTQLWEERGDAGRSKAADFAAEGVNWRPADKASVMRNAERVTARLRDYDQNKQPGLMVFSNCKKTREMFAALPIDDGDSTVPCNKSPLRHWFDVVAYACARASRGAGSILMEMHPFSLEEREEEPVARASGTSFGYGG